MRLSRRPVALVVALAAVLLTFACSGITDPSKNKTESVNGVIPLLGVGPVHTFTVSKRGEFSLTMTSLVPATGSLVALSLGQIVSSSCSYFNVVPAKLGTPATSGPIDKGTYCFALSDPGTLTQEETYALTVSYP